MCSSMSVHVRSGKLRHSSPTRRKVTKGYAQSRQDYDRRRRRTVRTADDRDYFELVKHDPCSYCGARIGGQSDHIVGLKAGGEDHWTNYTGACESCNKAKKNQHPLLFMLRRLPY